MTAYSHRPPPLSVPYQPVHTSNSTARASVARPRRARPTNPNQNRPSAATPVGPEHLAHDLSRVAVAGGCSQLTNTQTAPPGCTLLPITAFVAGPTGTPEGGTEAGAGSSRQAVRTAGRGRHHSAITPLRRLSLPVRYRYRYQPVQQATVCRYQILVHVPVPWYRSGRPLPAASSRKTPDF